MRIRQISDAPWVGARGGWGGGKKTTKNSRISRDSSAKGRSILSEVFRHRRRRSLEGRERHCMRTEGGRVREHYEGITKEGILFSEEGGGKRRSSDLERGGQTTPGKRGKTHSLP